jgi:hypothetical protein
MTCLGLADKGHMDGSLLPEAALHTSYLVRLCWLGWTVAFLAHCGLTIPVQITPATNALSLRPPGPPPLPPPPALPPTCFINAGTTLPTVLHLTRL